RRPTACEDGGRLGESQHSQAPDAPAGASPTNQLISSSLPAPVSRFRLPIHLRGSGNRKQPAISFLQIHQLSLKQVHQLSWPLIPLAFSSFSVSPLPHSPVHGATAPARRSRHSLKSSKLADVEAKGRPVAASSKTISALLASMWPSSEDPSSARVGPPSACHHRRPSV